MSDEMKARLENILYYHKSKILAVAGAAALVIAGIALDGGNDAATALYGVAVNVTLSRENCDTACSRAAGAIGIDPEKEEVILETGLEIDTQNPESNAMSGTLERMTTSIFSHELDFMICTEEVMDYYAGLGGLETVDETWAGVALSGGADQEQYLVRSRDKSRETDYYGICINDTLLSDGDGDTVFCIFKNSEHKDEALTFVRSLFQEE